MNCILLNTLFLCNMCWRCGMAGTGKRQCIRGKTFDLRVRSMEV